MKLDLGSIEITGGNGKPEFRKLFLERYPHEYYAAEENELQIDCDNEADLTFFKTMWFRFRNDLREQGLVDMLRYEIKPSKTAGHYHIIVELAEGLDIVDRILLQSVLGSDRRREIRNWGRAKLAMKDPILLAGRR